MEEVGEQPLPDESTHAKRLWNIAAAVLLTMAFGARLQSFWSALHRPLMFDDAYMFARYAAHMRQGLGMAWNLDGVPTYGPTSLPWVFVVWVLSFLPMGTWTQLVLGSWVSAIGAMVAIAWAIAANSQTAMLRSVWRVLPLVVVPVTATTVFGNNAFIGMETMLAALVVGVYVGVSLMWGRGAARAEWVGVVGVLSFLVRPESGLAVVLLPAMVFFLKPFGGVAKRGLIVLLCVVLTGVGLDLLACKLYFHTALPLSFYMKGHQAYAGFTGVFHPELSMLAFLAACQLYLAAMLLLTRRSEWRLVVCCVVPALAVFAYLQSVAQIMGFYSRYYAPYFAYLIVPAVLVAERWWVEPREMVSRLRGCAAVAMVIIFIALSSEAAQNKVRRLEGRSTFEYYAPRLNISAKAPLPDKFWDTSMQEVTDLLVVPLPKGATVAATEVGYLGSRAAQVNVIDMAGLNDTEIALTGFHSNALLRRRPDLIWMPHEIYSYMRGELYTDPALLAQYDVYAEAAKFGLAVRKDSPNRALMERQMQLYWQTAYPGTSIEDYRVRSASWSGSGHRISGK